MYTTTDIGISLAIPRTVRYTLTFPRGLVDIEACNRVLEVTHVGKTIGTDRTKLRQLIVSAKDLLDVCR